ncbi:MAG TPA: hypothetical protein VF665_11315 [Longimicrobium sp.]|jgi:4'-phosphopantetheinyl transferase EntD|uniref:hypothetical protein n=1 Tax=Longimicrobium sp. TaxID=2029185 RepID=UPI002ED9C1EE
MTHMLEEAIRVVMDLPDQEQDDLAAVILAVVANERRWAESFARSHHVLEELAREVLNAHRAGRTQPLDPENLVGCLRHDGCG